MTGAILLEKLEELRERSNLDVITFCQELGISKSTYYGWKRGNTPKGIEDALRLLKLLEIID